MPDNIPIYNIIIKNYNEEELIEIKQQISLDKDVACIRLWKFGSDGKSTIDIIWDEFLTVECYKVGPEEKQ